MTDPHTPLRRTRAVREDEETRAECRCGSGFVAPRNCPTWETWRARHSGEGHAPVRSTFDRLTRPMVFRRTRQGVVVVPDADEDTR